MNESILGNIKKLLGPGYDYNHFDTDLIIHINTYLAVLYQLGVGKKNFSITGASETWSDFLGEDSTNLQGVKTFVYLRVRLVFDPPTNGTVLDAMERTAKELEWRLNVTVDPEEVEDSK